LPVIVPRDLGSPVAVQGCQAGTLVATGVALWVVHGADNLAVFACHGSYRARIVAWLHPPTHVAASVVWTGRTELRQASCGLVESEVGGERGRLLKGLDGVLVEHAVRAIVGSRAPRRLQPLEETIEGGSAEGPWGLDYILSSMIKEYLLSDRDDAAPTFARRFDDLYGDVYVPKFNGYSGQKKGWTGYLIAFYGTLFTSAVAMQYDDPKQDKIIQLLVELRKLPVHAVKIFVVSPLPSPDWSLLD
jgi:hypothetical protein